MINKINSFPTDDGTYMLALPRQGELTDLRSKRGRRRRDRGGIDRFAKQTRSASPRLGQKGDRNSDG